MRKYWILLAMYAMGIVVSGIHPKTYEIWFLEVFPAIIGVLVLIITFRKFRFTYLTYVFILIHCYILFIGGHYTYAEVPLFDWIKEFFGQARNNYDKVGHFAQGFVPALITRELFVRKKVVTEGTWTSFLTVTVCMSISVMYEFLEWFVAVVSGTAADAFLGTQGYIWDTQSDMLWATIGALCMVLFVVKIQNKSIEQLTHTLQAES